MSEKDAHMAWLEVTGEGNTKGTIERLRRERRELLQRMKEEVCACIMGILQKNKNVLFRMKTG